MDSPQDELFEVVQRLTQLAEACDEECVQEPLRRLEEAAERAGKAWSGSWLGYQANVYYRDLKVPPPGAHFSVDSGTQGPSFGQGTIGEWVEYRAEDVEAAVRDMAGKPDLEPARGTFGRIAEKLEEEKLRVLSIVEVSGVVSGGLLEKLTDDIEALGTTTEAKIIGGLSPSGSIRTHDVLAVGQGIWPPPHISVVAEVIKIQLAIEKTRSLLTLTKQLRTHLMRVLSTRARESVRAGSTVFIGHGKSLVWRELKDFLEDRLRLSVDEFNSVSVAGVSTVERLSEMLDAATFAFLVMTGEDEQPDGKVNARLNVVHEVGLFQGRLGFERAIVLLEEGCEEFSNIAGLGQIRFPAGNLASKFEEVRQVLEREGLLVDS